MRLEPDFEELLRLKCATKRAQDKADLAILLKVKKNGTVAD